MFHTFEASRPPPVGPTADSAESRRPKTRACLSCRKRKIRCDGEVPCGACKWYQKDDQCSLMSEVRRSSEAATKRQTASRWAASKNIVHKLFPSQSLHDLASLSRDQLLEQLQQHPTSPRTGPLDPISDSQDVDRDSQEDSSSLEQLQAFPVPGTAAVSRQQSPSATNGVTDDINALALSVKTASSYLGVSSVVAVLRIILLLDPDSKAFAASSTSNNDRAGFSSAASEGIRGHTEPLSASSTTRRQPTIWDEVPAINAFFTYVHPQIPLLDEERFRDCYMNRKRDDGRWKLLLNAVLAMGSVAANTAEDKTHFIFYERARERLVLDTFSHARLETVQALVILGGMYLHYVQQPNLANFLIGATFRMATTLGLHRDFSESATASNTSTDFSRVAELRRRIWWSLCSLDACNSNFLGRPTSGRLGPGHNVKRPEHSLNNDPAITALLQDSIDYCIISTRMDDYLADRLVLGSSTRQELDHAFLSWLDRPYVGQFLASPDTSAGVIVAKNVMRWRCLSARVFIYRPILLWFALRRDSMSRISDTKREAILACRRIAAELIEEISSTWQVPSPCLMAGWPATWLLYQTSMVPLLSLFCDSDRPDVVASSRQQVELVISTLLQLESWSCTARRSLEVVTRLYNAASAYHVRQQQRQPRNQREDRFDEEAVAFRPATDNVELGDFLEGPAQGTPATHLSGSAVEDFLLGDFFDDLSWMNNQDQMMYGVGNDLAFLDHYDI
ncbi:transcriptional regulatory protein GAL4 [Microdochium nivale]|nr:transcriptional regulatory protein GAL4 [Microdochium nivale]